MFRAGLIVMLLFSVLAVVFAQPSLPPDSVRMKVLMPTISRLQRWSRLATLPSTLWDATQRR